MNKDKESDNNKSCGKRTDNYTNCGSKFQAKSDCRSNSSTHDQDHEAHWGKVKARAILLNSGKKYGKGKGKRNKYRLPSWMPRKGKGKGKGDGKFKRSYNVIDAGDGSTDDDYESKWGAYGASWSSYSTHWNAPTRSRRTSFLFLARIDGATENSDRVAFNAQDETTRQGTPFSPPSESRTGPPTSR